MTAPLLVFRLRAIGVSLHTDGTRLIVDAPRGVITSDLREQMTRLKPDILSELEAEALAIYADAPAREAIREIAGLLATAYRRSQNVAPYRDSGDDGLANSATSSVHGVVP